MCRYALLRALWGNLGATGSTTVRYIGLGRIKGEYQFVPSASEASGGAHAGGKGLRADSLPKAAPFI